MVSPEQERRNLDAFKKFASDFPQAVGIVHNKQAIAFQRSNGDEAVIYSTGTYITKENNYKSPPKTSNSVHNSIVELVNMDYEPVLFNSISLTQNGVRTKAIKLAAQSRRRIHERMPSASRRSGLMEQYYGAWGPTPARYAGIIRDYNDSFAALEKSFDTLEKKGFLTTKRRD